MIFEIKIVKTNYHLKQVLISFCSDSYFYEIINKHVKIYINNYFSKKWILFPTQKKV